ncbi:MAG: penicillin-binding protein 2, partial [Pseudolabrys sp.]
MSAADFPAPAAVVKKGEPRWQRVLRTMLYGANVDRNVKAKARLVLAIVVFIAVYAIIAARLVMFAVISDSHSGRRTVSQDAVATA